MKDIRYISNDELVLFLEKCGEKAFRAKQIREWLWKKDIQSFDEMLNLSLSLRESLKNNFEFKTTLIEKEEKSIDRTVKFVFKLFDGNKIEGVLIPSDKRVTACISSQVGCPLGCRFCATGSMGFTRHLHFSEIIDQYSLMNKKALEYYSHDISNIVYMGMGEPLINYDNVKKSIDILTSSEGKGLSPARITLSTVGIVQGIRRLADEGFKCGLAISLHSADEEKRKKIMPVTTSNTLLELQDALRYYVEKTKSRITIEYLLLDKINDSQNDAMKLAQFCRAFPVKINIIEYNTTDSEFVGSNPEKKEIFVNYLESKNLIVNIRHSRGQDISAACGQLLRK
jgi:23S rRNA (adenine2503-C2)-methyltransferase